MGKTMEMLLINTKKLVPQIKQSDNYLTGWIAKAPVNKRAYRRFKSGTEGRAR